MDRFWIGWLQAAAVGVIVFGLALVLLPGPARQGFAWLIYGSPDAIDRFGAEAVRYIGLAHAVIGAVMVGWGVLLFGVVRRSPAGDERSARTLIAVSVLAWFVPDTAYSLASGHAPNAVLNLVFLALLALPLLAMRRRR